VGELINMFAWKHACNVRLEAARRDEQLRRYSQAQDAQHAPERTDAALRRAEEQSTALRLERVKESLQRINRQVQTLKALPCAHSMALKDTGES
jgi:hypothetical protein